MSVGSMLERAQRFAFDSEGNPIAARPRGDREIKVRETRQFFNWTHGAEDREMVALVLKRAELTDQEEKVLRLLEEPAVRVDVKRTVPAGELSRYLKRGYTFRMAHTEERTDAGGNPVEVQLVEVEGMELQGYSQAYVAESLRLSPDQVFRIAARARRKIAKASR